ncbi:unnamed protein product [Effrenium voratum]|uniref:Uncharacterized protein n=1 Tax=Effrenium voratum TaxID=2562239 RepID=A0AA36JLB7_9DINO|nr:unnamed protein product [Effrenium voratum]CAJ1428805.1 unnamed protein product [Effrenium voratum]|eukprot:CAMPEP_0181439852 /NCGR_PEP_ID=MMETSP1110-20121109/22649_1 /TAXON_ID=174948 /ORGANISM="Symbiodinium sp., Strain CCMP421" /LENGTH=277 /DNA_ID=CAMNT_0023563605 /DNA_START=35 /DNA_END=868 /DNA_ORIENTATION=+
MYAPIRVQPETKYEAEVVVLVTSLGAKRTEFNAGKRARDLLEIKGAHHKIIDFNRDARQAGTGDAENKAIAKLNDDGKLKSGANNDLILPQVFIDGQYVGNGTDLQGLEDDGLLENILMRRACMCCNSSRRTPDMTQCPACWVKFEEILPGEMTISQALQEFHELALDEYDEDEDDDDDEGDEDMMLPAVTGMATEFPEERGAHREGYGELPVDAALLRSAAFQPGEQVQYWSDSKNRYVDAVVDNIRLKEGKIVYDLNCKRGAHADKIRGYDPASE